MRACYALKGGTIDLEIEEEGKIKTLRHACMIGKKTAVLFEAACKVGGLVSNGTPDQVDARARVFRNYR